MKTTKNLIALALIAIAVFVIGGCEKKEKLADPPIIREQPPIPAHYVRTYIKLENIFTPDDAKLYQGKSYVYVLPVRFNKVKSESYSDNKPENKYIASGKVYDSICVAHKDTDYVNNRWKTHVDLDVPVTYLRMTVDVISDVDYDAAHPAGTSLVDMINISVGSAKEVLDNKPDDFLFTYDKYDAYDFSSCNGYNAFYQGHPLRMPLTQFNAENRNLITQFYLRFTSEPRYTSKHRFTITCRDEKGKVFTTTTLPVEVRSNQLI